MGEVFWLNDLNKFITKDNFYQIIPQQSMTFAQQLNAMSRFALYYTIVIFTINYDIRYLYYCMFFLLLMAVLFKYYESIRKKDRFIEEQLNIQKDKKNRYCYRPTKSNPFMNVSFADYKDFPNRPKACDITKKHVKQQVKNLFDETVVRDSKDIFHRNTNDRQFYTVPVTTIPNNQTEFAKWLYDTGKTCKEGNGSKCTVWQHGK